MNFAACRSEIIFKTIENRKARHCYFALRRISTIRVMKNQKNNPGQQQGSGMDVNRGQTGQNQRNQQQGNESERSNWSQESNAATNREDTQAESKKEQPRMGQKSNPRRQPLGSDALNEENEMDETLRESEEDEEDESRSR